jgi:hypothetical protein
MLYDSSMLCWRYAGGANTGDTLRDISFNTIGQGPYTCAAMSDMKPPDIGIAVFGREILFLDYTAKDKPFAISLVDQSGIYPQSVKVLLNNQSLQKEAISSIVTHGDLRTLSLTAYPPQEHRVDSLTIMAADLAGNETEKTFAYMSGEDLKIKFLSCHPNPFTAAINPYDHTQQQIRFAFLLADMASDITLSIYTVSGKKIRTWKFSDLIGYQEVPWDGRDQDGYRIGNGTYYAKLMVKNDRKSDKKIIRIAKLEGF